MTRNKTTVGCVALVAMGLLSGCLPSVESIGRSMLVSACLGHLVVLGALWSLFRVWDWRCAEFGVRFDIRSYSTLATLTVVASIVLCLWAGYQVLSLAFFFTVSAQLTISLLAWRARFSSSPSDSFRVAPWVGSVAVVAIALPMAAGVVSEDLGYGIVVVLLVAAYGFILPSVVYAILMLEARSARRKWEACLEEPEAVDDPRAW